MTSMLDGTMVLPRHRGTIFWRCQSIQCRSRYVLLPRYRSSLPRFYRMEL